jgi:nucleoside-diphosphate-sugar epimerase
LFTVYGPGEHPGRLLPSLIKAARTGDPLPLSNGSQSRDFTYVEDVAQALLDLGTSAAVAGEVVNVATGRLTRVRDFIEAAAAVLRICPETLLFGEAPARPWEMIHAPVTLERLRTLVGWIPATQVVEGIRRTAIWHGVPTASTTKPTVLAEICTCESI